MKSISHSLCTIILLSCINVFSKNSDVYEIAFTNIYQNGIWGKNEAGQAHSGGGSTMQYTKAYRAYLQKFMKNHEITSVVDAGCGDWEFSRHINWNGINYVGYDIVATVIAKNIERYASANIHFIHGNCIETDLPEADLLICKHVLQHLDNKAIMKFLMQIKKFKYCLFTNEVDPKTLSSDNPEIRIIGGGHKIDLSMPPFNIKGKKVLTYPVGGAQHQVFLVDNTTNE